MVRAALTAAGALAASAPVAGAQTPPAPSGATVEARELIVTGPGWVRVALDGDALAAIPKGGGLAVLDPAGRPVPSRWLVAPRGTRPISLAATDEGTDGWSIVFDTGVLPLLYTRLVITPTRETAAQVRVLGSDDRAGWTPLIEGSFVRLGDDAGLARTALELPPARFRYLRVDWPRAAGFPALEGAAVALRESAPAEAPTLAGRVHATLEPGSWRIELPAAGLRGTRLVLRGTDLAGVALRVLAAREGRWEPLADVAACAAPCAIALPSEPLPSAALRIEGEAVRGPMIDGVTLELEPAWLLFEAAEGGTHRVVPAAAGAPASDTTAAVEGPVAAIPLGGPVESPLAPLDADVTELAPAGRMPRGWISWPLVVPPSVRPGDVVRVEFDDALLAQPGVRADGLRPMVGDLVVPFVLEIEDEPKAGPGASAAAGRVTLPVGPADVAGLEVEMRAAPGVRCDGEIEATWVRRLRPGVEDRGPAGRGAWSRGATGAGPCLAFVSLVLPELATAVELAARAGSTEPASARTWRARLAVRFAWPDLSRRPDSAQGVRLASGFDPLLELSPRVQSVRRQLELRPVSPGAVDLERTKAEVERMTRLTRWALWGALAVAAAVLFVVLGRGLSRRSTGT